MTAQEEGRSKEDFASLQGGDWFILVAVLKLPGFHLPVTTWHGPNKSAALVRSQPTSVNCRQ